MVRSGHVRSPNVVIIAPRDEAGRSQKPENVIAVMPADGALITYVLRVRLMARVSCRWRLPGPEVIAGMTHHAER